jgi:hypothetical protein
MAVFKDNLEQVIIASNGTTVGLVKRDRQLDLDFNALDGRITRARSILNDLNEKVCGGRDFNLRSTDPCGLDCLHAGRCRDCCGAGELDDTALVPLREGRGPYR